MRHIAGAEAAIAQLRQGCQLQLRAEPTNRQNPHAQQILDESGREVGYLPNYLADEFAKVRNSADTIGLTVLKVNPPPGGVHHRLLCAFTCSLELGAKLFQGTMYEPISADARPMAA